MGSHFTEIKNRLGPFRLALLPIGAYLPRWFMHPVHLSPNEAIEVHQILEPRVSLAIHFGTFALSVYSSLGAESLHPLSPLTTTLTYGPIGRDGRADVRLVYDHRVLDGATVARALARLEAALTGPVLGELREAAPARRAG